MKPTNQIQVHVTNQHVSRRHETSNLTRLPLQTLCLRNYGLKCLRLITPSLSTLCLRDCRLKYFFVNPNYYKTSSLKGKNTLSPTLQMT